MPTDEERQQIEEDLYSSLSDEQAELECPITRKKWLSPDLLKRHVTEESVRACTALGPSACDQYEAENIVKNAKRAFAVLILCYYDRIIVDELLVREGLTDEDLPLARAPNSRSLVSTKKHRNKEFKAFAKLRPPDVKNFLDRQWLVLPPVFDEGGPRPVAPPICDLSTSCPLPLRNKQHLTNTEMSSVSKCELHPAHYRSSGKQVSSNL